MFAYCSEIVRGLFYLIEVWTKLDRLDRVDKSLYILSKTDLLTDWTEFCTFCQKSLLTDWTELLSILSVYTDYTDFVQFVKNLSKIC